MHLSSGVVEAAKNFVVVFFAGKKWPPNHYDEPVGTKLFFTFGNPKDAAKALVRIRAGDGLSVCDLQGSSEEQAKGRWVTIYDDMENHVFRTTDREGVAGPKDGKVKGGTYILPAPENRRGALIRPWVDHKGYMWTPYNCKMPRVFSPEDARKCMDGKSLHLRGDSHMRQLFNGFLTYACGGKGAIYDTWHSDQCIDDRLLCKGPGFKNICLKDDSDGTNIGNLAGVDLTVQNFGQHPADGAHHWTFDHYKQQANSLAAKLSGQDKAVRKKKFLWHETNAMMFRKDSWIIAYNDWRTNSRIGAYNLHATAKMKELDVGIIPTFRQTLGMVCD